MAGGSEQEPGGGAERRAHERLAVDLPARVDLDGRDARAGRILDFCVGGLFINVSGQEDDYLVMAARQIGRGDRLRVSFQAQGDSGPETFVMHVKVARLFLGGMRVAFDPPEPAAVRALERIAGRARQDAAAHGGGAAVAGSLPAGDAAAVLQVLRQRLERWMREKLDDVFKRACDELFIEARDAVNNDIQAESLDAMKDLERVKTTVRDTAAGAVLRAFDKLSPGGGSLKEPAFGDGGAERGGLSLVDTGSFDDWVTTKNIMTRHEPKLREDAYALARRLSVVAGRTVDELANPAGVQQVCSAFNEAMQNLGLQRRARKAIYHAFENGLVAKLEDLHGALNATLVERGVLPTVERPLPSAATRPAPPRPAARTEAPPAAPCGPAAEPCAPGEMPPRAGHPQHVPVAPAAHGHAPPGGGVAPGRYAGGGGQESSAQVPAGHGAVSQGPGRGGSAPTGTGQWQPPAGAPGPLSDPEGGAGPAVGLQPMYQSPIRSTVPQVGMAQAYQAARSIMGLQRAVSAGAPVAAHAAPAVTPPQRSGTGASRAILDALGTLQSEAEFAQPAPRQPLRLKERLRQSLARDGIALSSEENEAVDVLSGLIEAVLGDPLIQEQIKPRIQRLSVPLLRVALQDQGFFSEESNPARQVVNRLGMLGLSEVLEAGETGDSLRGSVDPLLDRIVSDPKAGPMAFEAVLPELDAIVQRQQQRYTENVVSIAEVRERQQAALAERRHAGAGAAPRRVAPELEPWFQRARRLKVGDVVTFRAGSDDPDPRTLAWTSDDHETFVFTDRTGRQTVSVAQQELALELLRGSAKVLDSPDVPAMDRGVYQMLHEIHRSLAEEGRRDSVTGLMPMSAFIARVEEAIGRAQRRGSKHVLLALNLDGFAVINDKCGRAAGDSLLRKLSRLLERQISEHGCITRSYADEFLILLEDTSFQDGRRFAERQCRAVGNSRVVFEGEQYPITASIGMVPVTRAGESVEAVIDAARAALAGAKRRGGNQLRVFDPDEDEIPEESGSAPEAPGAGAAAQDLGSLLDAGRLVLQRQMVSPIADDSQARPHFEVLLGVRGDDGVVEVASDDLLVEAERGERMPDVDRWVIGAALEWMAANRREVVRSGGYAIDLSAATLADEGFLAFVVDALTRTAVPPAKVIFEVTESSAIDRLSSAVDFIRTLREYGCRFAITDFGAGQATFSYLKTLPVDFVKIDGLFVRDLAESDSDFAMVKSINEISHLLGKHTIAEHVNGEAVLDRLKELGVDYAQGSVVQARETLA